MTKKVDFKPFIAQDVREDDEGFVTINTQSEFERWVKEGGWKDGADFKRDTGMGFENLRGRAFTVMGRSVSFK